MRAAQKELDRLKAQLEPAEASGMALKAGPQARPLSKYAASAEQHPEPGQQLRQLEQERQQLEELLQVEQQRNQLVQGKQQDHQGQRQEEQQKQHIHAQEQKQAKLEGALRQAMADYHMLLKGKE